MNGVMIFITYLGNWQTIVGLGIVALVILWRLNKKREAGFFVVALISGEIIKELLKLLFHKERPDASLALIQESGYAFPSGHAFMSVIFYGMLCYFIYRARENKWQKIILLIATIILIFLIGYSRVYLGVHWISDVIAGWLIGGAMLAFFIVKLKNIKS
ncbi:MAG: phosphatase PAP2 family protein [Candidatus Azambacteria bacterium]|nr:phosphatase PAP2 family protein [Candidatus Azambacteria bacterium]